MWGKQVKSEGNEVCMLVYQQQPWTGSERKNNNQPLQRWEMSECRRESSNAQLKATFCLLRKPALKRLRALVLYRVAKITQTHSLTTCGRSTWNREILWFPPVARVTRWTDAGHSEWRTRLHTPPYTHTEIHIQKACIQCELTSWQERMFKCLFCWGQINTHILL